METTSTFAGMLAHNFISVPSYQRAYSWDTNEKGRQVNTFYEDLCSYLSIPTKYYLGHFLFQQKSDTQYEVIDGQQRLTTGILFLSAAYHCLEAIRPLTEDEDFGKKMTIKMSGKYRFATVDYDDLVLRELIDGTQVSHSLDTESKKRLVAAYNYFETELRKLSEEDICRFITLLNNASCSTHIVKDETEATQIFLFQNNRGKKPTRLEVIKAQFIYQVLLYGGEEKDTLLKDIKDRFENIYKSIATIEANINEDDVLNYTAKVFYNNLCIDNADERIKKALQAQPDCVFVKNFTHCLANSFDAVQELYSNLYTQENRVQLLLALDNKPISIPFWIKGTALNPNVRDFMDMIEALDSLLLRAKVIGTRADLNTRLNDVFKSMEQENGLQKVVEHIQWMKGNHGGWWYYWDNQEFANALNRTWFEPATAKILLLCYENHLINAEKKGYDEVLYSKRGEFQLEHIAPQTDNEQPANGYPEYDEDFYNNQLNCLGNYLLLSGPHNAGIGNRPFAEKRGTYNVLYQQREVQNMTPDAQWTKENIQSRKQKIVEFLLETY